MTEKELIFTRRKFIAAGSAALAAPFVMNLAGNAMEVKAAEGTTHNPAYYINDNCILCPPSFPCKNGCPVKAISYDGEKMAIDANICIRCGNCSKVCEIGAVTDANAPPPVVKPHDTISRECDFLVVGGGFSGLVAAAIAADLSGKGKKIIVLEKAKRPGGSGFYPSTGIRLFATKWQRDAGDPGHIDDYIRSAMDITRWELNPQLVANSLQAIPAFFDWFCTWAKPEEIFSLIDSPFSKKRKEIEITKLRTERCRKIVHRLIDKCKELGVEILTEHAATDFIMGDKEEITGVIARDPGGTTTFRCKYCMVSTGNVIDCNMLMVRSAPEYVNAFKRRSGHHFPTNTGDGVLMAEKAGIPIDYKNVCVISTGANSCIAEAQLMNQDSRGEGLYINLNGKRWVNEAYIQLDVENGFFPVLRRQPRCMFYTIMDSKTVMMDRLPSLRIGTTEPSPDKTMAAGAPLADMVTLVNGAPLPEEILTGTVFNFPGRENPDLKELQRIASLKGNHLFIADTLEELADKMGVDRKVLVSTVKRYNELCARGYDDDFFKPAMYLLPVEKGPFYASSHYLGTDGALGGLAVNENMQVAGHNGPIENLYAAGDTTGSFFIMRNGQLNPILPMGTWAVASGFLAGENVGKQLKKA
jgi:fumarate reductase flavoprotein subunit